MAKKQSFKIGEACRELDIQPYVLRYWETEFPFFKPAKANAGQRVYSASELHVIRRIKELLYDEGYTIAGAKKKLEAEIEQGGPRSLAVAKTSAAEGGESDNSGGSGDSGETGDRAEADGAEGAVENGRAAQEPLPITLVTGKPPQNGPNPTPAPQSQLSLDGEPASLLDSSSAERVQTVVRGLRDLRDQAHEILQILRRNP